MNTLIILQSIFVLIAMFCFVPTVSDKAKRQYGRWFGTRADTEIWYMLTIILCGVSLIMWALSVIWR